MNYHLGKGTITLLISYYFIILIVGLYTAYNSLIIGATESKIIVTKVALHGGIGTSLFGCSIFYIRKIYKALIDGRIVREKEDDWDLKEMGNVIYLFFRPLFAVGFVFLLAITLRTSVKAITIKESMLSQGFIHFVMFLSFFIGFGAGRLLDILNGMTEDVLKKIFRNG